MRVFIYFYKYNGNEKNMFDTYETDDTNVS